MSDNDLRAVGNVPRLLRLRHLLLNNNKIATIERSVAVALPNLRTLILTNNALANLEDIDVLVEATQLRSLSLLQNPLTAKVRALRRRHRKWRFACTRSRAKNHARVVVHVQLWWRGRCVLLAVPNRSL